MKNLIFQEYGNSLTLESLNAVEFFLRKIDTKVKNYTNFERERYYILKYILLLAQNNKLDYPVYIECLDLGKKNNLPDFKLVESGREYVLEAIMATTEEFMHQSRVLFKDKKTIEHKVWIEGQKVRISTRDASKLLLGLPVGNQIPEMAFAIIVSDAIKKKLLKSKQYDVDRNLKKELLVYYNFPLQSIINTNNALVALYNYVHIVDSIKTEFAKVHILTDNKLIYNVFEESEIEFFYLSE